MGIIDAILKRTGHDAESTFVRAETLCRQGYYSDASDILDKVITAEPGHVRALQLKGFALYQMGSFEEALQYFDQALGIDSNLPEALVFKGLIYSGFGKHTLSLGLYDRALAIHPGFIQALYAKGLTLATLENYDEAILAYDQLLALQPKHVDTLIGVSIARKKQKTGRKDSTLLHHPESDLPEKFVSVPVKPVTCPLVPAPVSELPPYPSPHSAVPMPPSVKLRNVSPGAALPVMSYSITPRRPSRTVPEMSPFPFLEESLLETDPAPAPAMPQCSTYEEMIREIAGDPEKVPGPDRWRVLGTLSMKLGKYRDAVGLFERYLETVSDDADAWRSLGNARKKCGIYDEAITAYERSLDIDPSNPSVWINHAKNLVMLGEHDGALGSCDRAIALDETFTEAWVYKGFILNKNRRGQIKNQ